MAWDAIATKLVKRKIMTKKCRKCKGDHNQYLTCQEKTR